MTTTQTFDDIISGNQFDIRTVIERFEELENELEVAYGTDAAEDKPVFDEWIEGMYDEDTAVEFLRIRSFLEDVRANGGDEQWRGDWYPLGFIADSYFRDYAEELAEDIGAINAEATWPNNCIDWDRAAEQLQQDYTLLTVNGTGTSGEFWYR